MRERFIEKIGEAGRAVWSIKMFNLTLNATICFLGFSVILILLGVNMLMYGFIPIAIIPTAVYIIFAVIREVIKSDIIKTVEKKQDNLKESLKTAYDNRDNSNIITESLLSDVSNGMDNMETATFMDSKGVSKKVVASMALAFIMLFATVLNIRGGMSNLFDLDNAMRNLELSLKERGIEYEKVLGGGDRWEGSNLSTDQEKNKLGAQSGGERPGFNTGMTPGSGGGIGSDESSDIYGEASSAAIEGENVDFNLRPDYGGEIEIKEDETQDEQQISITNPEGVESTEKCDECAIGPGHEDLVKRYFEKILGEA